jgi:hypothetical protein
MNRKIKLQKSYKVALEQVSSEYFGFPCQLSFHQMLHIHLSYGRSKIDQLVADVQRDSVSLQPT